MTCPLEALWRQQDEDCEGWPAPDAAWLRGRVGGGGEAGWREGEGRREGTLVRNALSWRRRGCGSAGSAWGRWGSGREGAAQIADPCRTEEESECVSE